MKYFAINKMNYLTMAKIKTFIIPQHVRDECNYKTADRQIMFLCCDVKCTNNAHANYTRLI